jgi:phage terminase large subunit GpA-like protein
VGTDNAKELIYNRLKIQPDGDQPVPGCVHFPADDNICDEAELKQLTSESKKWVVVRGRRVFRWDASKRRNEALDCYVYAIAALRISQQRFGLDLDELSRGLPQVIERPQDESLDEPDEISAPASEPEPATHQPPAEPASVGGWVDTGRGAWL